MSATSGVVALVTAQIPLVGCGTACATAPNVKDLVGYGATANVETLAAPGLTNTTADARSGALVDTDNNAVDFTSGVPKATNSAGRHGHRGDATRAAPATRRPAPPASTTSRARAGSPRSSARASRTSPASSRPSGPRAARAASGSRTRRPTPTR